MGFSVRHYIVDLHNSHPNYVPAIIAKAFYRNAYKSEALAIRALLFQIITDYQANPNDYEDEFEGLIETENNLNNNVIKIIQQYNVTLSENVERVWTKSGTKLSYLQMALLVAPDKIITPPTTPNDDVQDIPVGQGQANMICIDSGLNGVCETFAQGDDVQLLAASYEIIDGEQNNTEDEGATNPPPASPSSPTEGTYQLVDSSGTIKVFFIIGDSDVFETVTNFNLSTLTNELAITGEIQMTDDPPPTEYLEWITENFDEIWWVHLLSIDQQIGGVFGGPIGIITHPNELLSATANGDDYGGNSRVCIMIVGENPLVIESIHWVSLGLNGVCDTPALGNDIQVRPCVDVPFKPSINTGPDGVCNTFAQGDDTQIILTNCGNPGATCITAGPNLIRETHEKGDDVVDGTSLLVGDNGICDSSANQ